MQLFEQKFGGCIDACPIKSFVRTKYFWRTKTEIKSTTPHFLKIEAQENFLAPIFKTPIRLDPFYARTVIPPRTFPILAVKMTATKPSSIIDAHRLAWPEVGSAKEITEVNVDDVLRKMQLQPLPHDHVFTWDTLTSVSKLCARGSMVEEDGLWRTARADRPIIDGGNAFWEISTKGDVTFGVAGMYPTKNGKMFGQFLCLATTQELGALPGNLRRCVGHFFPRGESARFIVQFNTTTGFFAVAEVSEPRAGPDGEPMTVLHDYFACFIPADLCLRDKGRVFPVFSSGAHSSCAFLRSSCYDDERVSMIPGRSANGMGALFFTNPASQMTSVDRYTDTSNDSTGDDNDDDPADRRVERSGRTINSLDECSCDECAVACVPSTSERAVCA